MKEQIRFMENYMLEAILDNCTIKLEKKPISKELLMKKYGNYLSHMINCDGHNVGIVLHTGSICFEAVSLVYSAIANLLECKTNATELILRLEPGTFVLYGADRRQRYIFDGIVAGKEISSSFIDSTYVILKQDNGKITYVPENKWGMIEPYKGKSKTLSGQGIRKRDTKRNQFFKDVLGYENDRIPSIVDSSSVVICSKEKADFLLNNISIEFNDSEISLLDLITASYYTENEEIPYRGNSGRNEPVIKIASKISVARKLIKIRNGNSHLGLFVLGKEQIRKGYSELPELVNRKSLKYVFLCTQNEIVDTSILPENGEYKVFTCTKNFLLEKVMPQIIHENKYTKELMEQVDLIVEKILTPIKLNDSPVKTEEYKRFKMTLFAISKDDYDDKAKCEFITQAYSLMNLYTTMVFSEEEIKITKDEELVDIETPEERIIRLNHISNGFPPYLLDKANYIIDLLKKIRKRLDNGNEKEKWLKEHLSKHDKKIKAIIVPKAYYAKIIKSNYQYYMTRNATISTANKFDAHRYYDEIIVIGNIDGSKFNMFVNNSAPDVFNLLYECEVSKYKKSEKIANDNIELLNSHSYYEIEGDVEEDQNDFVIDEEMEVLDENLNEYIFDTNTIIDNDIASNRYYMGNTNMIAEIVMVLFFSDDRKAYITPKYKGYLLDENTGNVTEAGPSEFCEGESIIFTNNNEDTKDIVDSVLERLINAGSLHDYKEIYRKSKLWKNELNKYRCEKGLSLQELAEYMVKKGSIVQVPTILGWLNEESHTVGPRNIKSIIQIGEITDNYELKNQSDEIFDACKKIREKRRRILSEIGQAIIDKYRKKKVTAGTEFDLIYNQIDSLAEVLEIEKIILVNRKIPWNMANRPTD